MNVTCQVHLKNSINVTGQLHLNKFNHCHRSTSPKNSIKVTGQLHLKNQSMSQVKKNFNQSYRSTSPKKFNQCFTSCNLHKVNLKSYLARSSLNEI